MYTRKTLNLSTGRLSKIRHLLDDPRFVFLHDDVTERIVVDEKIMEIYNLACPTSDAQYSKVPLSTFKTSIPST